MKNWKCLVSVVFLSSVVLSCDSLHSVDVENQEAAVTWNQLASNWQAIKFNEIIEDCCNGIDDDYDGVVDNIEECGNEFQYLPQNTEPDCSCPESVATDIEFALSQMTPAVRQAIGSIDCVIDNDINNYMNDCAGYRRQLGMAVGNHVYVNGCYLNGWGGCDANDPYDEVDRTVVHEASHAYDTVLHFQGIFPRIDSSRMSANYLGYLVDMHDRFDNTYAGHAPWEVLKPSILFEDVVLSGAVNLGKNTYEGNSNNASSRYHPNCTGEDPSEHGFAPGWGDVNVGYGAVNSEEDCAELLSVITVEPVPAICSVFDNSSLVGLSQGYDELAVLAKLGILRQFNMITRQQYDGRILREGAFRTSHHAAESQV